MTLSIWPKNHPYNNLEKQKQTNKQKTAKQKQNKQTNKKKQEKQNKTKLFFSFGRKFPNSSTDVISSLAVTDDCFN